MLHIGKFFNTTRLGTKITAQVEGNHGIYTVSIQLKMLTSLLPVVAILVQVALAIIALL